MHHPTHKFGGVDTARLLLVVLLPAVWCQLSKAALSNPLKDPHICGRPQCNSFTSKFAYADNIYKYDYTVNVRSEFSGSGDNTSDLIVKVNLDLLFPKPCEGYLRITDANLWDKPTSEFSSSSNSSTSSDDTYDYYNELLEDPATTSLELESLDLVHPKSNEMATDLKRYMLRFAFHDGLIGEVCPDAAEPIWVLNFKKGILSTIQNTMVRFDVDFNTTETDVSGECNVHYSLDSTDNVFVTIRKVKDISSCRNRHSTESILQTTPYSFRDDKTIWPILHSKSYCNMTIDGNLYKEVSCFERYQLIPFSNSSTGAVTTSHSKLEFKSEESYSNGEFLAENSDLIEKRSTLIFDHTPLIKPTHSEIKAARDLLQGMCAMGFPNIQREFIDVFTNFLQTAKSLDYRALSQLLARAEGICHNGKNHVLESLPYIASTASYQLMRDQIVANAIPKMLAQNWMTTLSFVQRPDADTLDTFYTILDFAQQESDPEYTLGATAVIHSFCRHNAHCGLNLQVQRIVNLLENEFSQLWHRFRSDRRQRERLIVILKGLGNMGVISDEFAKKLQILITEEVVPIDIKLQAVMTFRRVDCLKYRDYFLDTYANFTVNSEIRIFSYLQAMRCPDYFSIGIIKRILHTEEINQVGSFVWSHLTNLAKSSSPVRIEAQGLLLNDDLSDKFKMDIRKFSRNYEHSLFFDEYNFGATTDINLLFATDSYLPRMVILNFTTDLFGQSVNLFEFTARGEGFEELVSSIFGPKGPLNRELFRKKFGFLNRWLGNESSENDDTLENLLSIDNLRLKRGAEGEVLDEEDNDDYEFEEDLQRNKRSTTEHRKAALQQNVDRFGFKLKYNYNKPSAQIGLRIFGNDMRFYTLEGLLEVMTLAKEFDPFQQAKKILSGKEVTYTKSRVFLDASYNVPLSVGLPLAIHTFGASSVDLRVSGNLDRLEPNFDWYFDVEGRFKPSVSVDVITTMKSDMFYAIAGIKVKSNLYSDSEVEAKVKVRGRNLVSLAFNLPKDKNEIFSARSELLVIKGNVDVPQAGIKKRITNTTCSWPVLDEAIGLKMCSYLSVSDLSNSSNVIYPSLLLSGPLNFSVFLTKSDLTAKKFLFEYKWDQYDNNTEWSFVFHTPGSAVKRLLVTNVTTLTNAVNATVAFENGPRMISAGCKYNGSPENRKLDVFLDTNGNRSLDLNIQLLRYKDRSAWVYKPIMLLAINSVNITGLAGMIRINAKNGIVQNDFDLSFETKKLQALIRGNLVQTEITTSTNMTINYRFQANKVETINFDSKLINTSDKSKTEYRGNIKLKTSAYPKLNFASNATWLSVQGHTEGILTYNNAPNFLDSKYTSLMRVVFARSTSEDSILEGTRTRASFEVKVPKSKVDFKILIKHEERNKNGSEHNILIGLRYAPEKEATGLFSILLPRRNLLAVDAYINVTIPDFNSCTAHLKLFEKTPSDYMLNLNGSWFTGHMISIKGDYKDKSSRVQALHQMKLLIESPSFETSTLHIIYRRNQLVIFSDVRVKYGKDPYGLTVQYEANAENKNSNGQFHLKIKEKEYWLMGKLLADQPKLLEVEIHLDKVRDVQIKIGLLSVTQRKEVSLEFKWDVNRDPSMRMGLLAQYNNLGNSSFDGNIMVTYPGRTISSGFNVKTGGPKYYGDAQVSWNINEIVKITYQAGAMPGKHLHSWAITEITTPFEGWRNNRLEAGIYSVGNLVLVNSSLLWADDQRLELGYKSDFDLEEPIFSFDVRLGINSTITDIPTINVKVQHWQDTQKCDTDLYLRYSGLNDSMNVYSLKSNWEFYQDAKLQNISGTVLVQSPFEGYHKGGLAARLSLNDQREISGAASLVFDIREFTLAMDGYVKKYTDNMLTINITTPLEKFRTINARVGLNEKIRHAVAEVRAPVAALGAEVLCDIKSVMNFNVKLSVATPIDTFKQAALFAKVKSDTIDLRGMWNNTTLGFIGVWRMYNITDFEYSYQVFTPLPNFEENGFIAQFIKRDEFVLNLYGKLALYKLGIEINGQAKSKLLKQLGGNKLELMYDDDFRPPQELEDADYDMNDIDYDEFFSYFVDFKVDTLVWPTIDGVMDIQEIMDYYFIVGNLRLPQGRVDIKDRLYYPDYINVLNVLNVNTPFDKAKHVKSIFQYHIDLDFNAFYEKIHLMVIDNSSEVKEVGFELNYTKLEDTLKPKQHDVYLKIKTPFQLLQDLDVIGRLELDDTIYRGNISAKTSTTYLSLGASVESEDSFLETSVGILLQTNDIPYYACHAYFKKDGSEILDSVDIQFEVIDNVTLNKLQMEFDWRSLPNTLIDASAQIKTTMLPLKSATCAIVVQKTPEPALNFDLNLFGHDGYRVDWGARGHIKNDVVAMEIWTPMKNYKNISMHATLTPLSTAQGQYNISGTLYRNMATYSVNGVSRSSPDDYIVRLRIQPRTGGPDGVIEFSYNSGTSWDKAMNVQFSAIENGKMCQISSGYSVSDQTGVDFSVLIESTEPELAHINIHAKLLPQQEKGHLIGELLLETPWRQLGIDSVHLKSDVFKRSDGGKVVGEYKIGSNIGRGSCAWSWVFGENMQFILNSYLERPNARARIVHAGAKYLNPERNFQHLITGGQLNVDSKWNLEVNGSMKYISSDDIEVALITKLPAPIGDVHHLAARYYGNLLSKQGKDPNVFIETKYQSQEALKKFISRISYRNVTDLQGMGHVEWGVADDMAILGGDFEMLRKNEVRREFYAKVITPKFNNEDTFILTGSYDILAGEYHNLICSFDYPASRRIADLDVAFNSLSNMYGVVNSSTPFLNVTWFKADFNFSSTNIETYRYCHGEWPSDTAFFKLHSIYNKDVINHGLKGVIEMEVPLEERHYADIKYELQEQHKMDKGYVKVMHNNNQVLNGLYNRIEVSSYPKYKQTTVITLENEMKPLGVRYVKNQDFTKQPVISSLEHLQIYELGNEHKFNLTGELHSKHSPSGDELTLVAIHPNRTVVLTVTYDEEDDNIFKQRTKLQLSQTAWIGYYFELSNLSKPGNDSQNFVMELTYPKRTLSTEGWYYMTDNKFDSDIAFKWTGSTEDERKVVRTGLVWEALALHNEDRDNQAVCLTLVHPYLEKEVTFKGSYYRGIRDLLRANLVIDYSEDPRHLIELGAVLQDLYQELGHTNYTFQIFGHHKASELEMQFNGTLAAKPSYYKTESNAFYKRDYYPEKHGKFLALLDVNRKEFEYLRVSPYRTVRLWAMPLISYPIYGVNATVWDSPETNNTGYMFVDLNRKYARMDINLTDDGSQNLQMVGYIPDSRSGYLDIWRNYEEIRIIDVTSYLKMNHSRLITGRFHWRPNIKDDLKTKIRRVGESLYTSFSEGIDFWIKSLYSETTEAIGVIWDTFKGCNSQFLDDIGELSVIEDDLEDLRVFVNQSYEANDFYIKTVVNFTLTILDELAIRDHIESLPKIFTEIWQAMGDSGKALRKSIMWLIETIKSTYNNLLDAISRFFHGESLQYMSTLMEKGIEKYDKFVKDLHISFIKYVEKMWNKFWTMMSDYWKGVLKRLEPHIFKFMSYIESTAWDLSKEVFDFIYKRTNELAESPYYNQVSSFTQDVDRLYKDIKSHDAITNIKKYSTIVWNFLKEKYFKLVPFGAELNEVLTEIWEEIKELRKIEQVQIVIQKYDEILNKLEWIAEELQLESRLHQMYALMRNKFNHYALNALETADMYREAKTKFIFDPDVGIMDLEQKLPMSWHAFNETPKFEEIPEYKLLTTAQNLFSSTNSSIIRYIYSLKTHLDPKTWLPPYYSRALLIDSRHYMTFDKRFVGLNLNFEEMSGKFRNTQCSYLLAHDFARRNFTLMLEPAVSGSIRNKVATRKLSLMANGHLLEIDLGNDSLTVNGNSKPFLPLTIGDVTIHRELDVLTVYSEMEFSLHCNVPFDLCWFEVSGWYFGQTAGILGTMNNEYFDEYLTSYGKIAKSTEEFTDSWSVQECKQKKKQLTPISSPIPDRVHEICNNFFKQGLLSACTSTVDMGPFYEMCLDLGANSNAVREGHPAIKGACTAALAYIEACATSKIRLRVPDQCVFCQLSNGSYVSEGSFVELSGNSVPRSSDIVFIVEAKPCNANLTQEKNIMTIVQTIEEQLQENRIKNNRYAIVAFGGRAPFDKPRSITYQNRVFTRDLSELNLYFSHIIMNNGSNNDILQAISVATKMNFRPGVSKTFILISCSDCSAHHMRFDYSSILQYMMEEGVNLHILADTEFDFERTRKLRHFFGLDRYVVYSKRYPEGDMETRKHLHVSKNNMGICIPLALETNGSVFSARKLLPTHKYPVKRFATIIGKRIAASAVPHDQQTCECSGHNTGVAYMICSPSGSNDEKVNFDDYGMIFDEFNLDNISGEAYE